MYGEEVLAKASRPQGKPPNGTRSLAHSWVTHRQAVHSGQPGSREVSAWPAAISAMNRASNRASSSQASWPMTFSQNSSQSMNGTPKANPVQAACRAVRRWVSRLRPVTASTDSGHSPYGGKESASSRPHRTARPVLGSPARTRAQRFRARGRSPRGSAAAGSGRSAASGRTGSVGRATFATFARTHIWIVVVRTDSTTCDDGTA